MGTKLGELKEKVNAINLPKEGPILIQPSMEYIFDCTQRLLESSNKKFYHELTLEHQLLREHFAHQ
jgi:hypothetical protein